MAPPSNAEPAAAMTHHAGTVGSANTKQQRLQQQPEVDYNLPHAILT
jgi:hypothetical protein